MKFEVSERISTTARKEDLLLFLEDQFRKVSGNVRRQDDSLFVKSIEATFGSINRSDDSVIELKRAEDGWLVIALVNYRPSVAFWIIVILLLFTWIMWLLPIVFYLLQKKTVQNSIQDVFLRVKNEFQGSLVSHDTIESSNLEKIEKLAALKNKGIITEEEFSVKKKELLGL